MRRRSAANRVEFSEPGDYLAVALAVPVLTVKPERMLRMARTRWPGRVHKTVMKVLLNVFNEFVAIPNRIIGERGNTRGIVQNDRFVSRSEGRFDVQEQQLYDARPVALGNRHLNSSADVAVHKPVNAES